MADTINYKDLQLNFSLSNKCKTKLIDFLKLIGGSGNYARKDEKILSHFGTLSSRLKADSPLKEALNNLANSLWENKRKLPEVSKFFSCMKITYVLFKQKLVA